MVFLQLGRFKIKKWLGGGRFGDVYLAEDTLLKKDFAIKVARLSQSQTEVLLEEARLLADLQHPNIVKFFTIDVVDGRLIIVNEYVPGVTLRKVIEREGRLSKEKALFLATQLLSALHYAHEKGVIHRDVKPENIIIMENGTLKLLDFGLARAFDELGASIGGTPLYMAPEVWKGKATSKSDQWSAALIILEMLSGKHPFQSESLDELREKVFKGVEVEKFIEDEEIAEALSKAMEVEEFKRYSSCKEFMDALSGERTKFKVFPINVKVSKPSVLKKLTEEQKEAVYSHCPKILVIGGPGTGKTFTLIARAVHLVVDEGIKPEKILITTFNIRGCREIENKLKDEIPQEYDNFWLGNFHQIAFRILARFGHFIGLPHEIEITPPSHRGDIAKKLAQEVSRNIVASEPVIKDLLNRFYHARANLMDKETFLKHTRGRWNNILEFFWDSYHEKIVKSGRLDYDDIIYYAALLLKQFPEVAEFYRERIEYFLIDEVQDLNKAQIFILETLSSGKNIFLTGDDDQSVYQWRGADPSYMRKLKHEDFKVYRLTKSFRLHKDLKEVAFNLIQKNINRIPKVFWTERDSDSFVMDIKALKTPLEEAEFVCDIIDILRLKDGYSYSDFAVLYRTNARGRLFEQVMKRRRIQFSHQFGRSFYQREEIALALDVLKYVNRPSAISKKRIKNRAHVLGIKGNNKSELEAVLENLRQYKLPSEIIAQLSRFMGKLELEEKGEDKIARITTIEELYRQALSFEERSRTKTISAFLQYIKFLVDSGLAEEDEGVRLLSVHSAKGLEFPVVFLVGMVEGEFPFARSLVIPEELEEERRLCYTAITRAVEKLFITYYKFSSRYSRFEEKPSRFIREMFGA